MSFSLNVIIVSMTEVSPNKRRMKFKKQDPHPIFPSSVHLNVDHIRDIEIGHVDLAEFLKRIEKPPSYHDMEVVINSGIHLVANFPMSPQDLEFVVIVANHFDPVNTSVKDEVGKKLIGLDEELFELVFKCPSIERYSDITIQSTSAYFDKNSEKCSKNINDNWLKTPRPTIARWP